MQLTKVQSYVGGNPNMCTSVLVVNDIFEIKGRGIAVTGTVTSGEFRKGNKIIIKRQDGSIIKQR